MVTTRGESIFLLGPGLIICHVFLTRPIRSIGAECWLILRLRHQLTVASCTDKLAVIAAGFGFHDTRINRKPFAFDETRYHARLDHPLKELSKDVAVTVTAVAFALYRRQPIRPLSMETRGPTARPDFAKLSR